MNGTYPQQLSLHRKTISGTLQCGNVTWQHDTNKLTPCTNNNMLNMISLNVHVTDQIRLDLVSEKTKSLWDINKSRLFFSKSNKQHT